MTTSGTIAQTSIDVATLIEHAFRRAGIQTPDQTPDAMAAARQNLYFYLMSLSNRGVNLWTIEKIIAGSYNARAAYPVGVGTIDLKSVLYRTVNLPSGGTAASSAGGSVDNAFDQDLDTYALQTSANGNISYAWSDQHIITNVGIMAYGNQTYTLAWETSQDGVTWTTVLSTPQTNYTDKEWAYYDVDRPIQAYYFRVRETGGGILSVRELCFNTVSIELPMARINFDMYANLTQKTETSRSIPQYWFNRKVDNPEITVWPIPYYYFDQFVMWRTRQIQDVGRLTNTLDLPQRWAEAAVTELARRMVLELPKVDTSRYQLLKAEADEATAMAEQEERDNSPIFIAPNISPYTR